MLNVDKQRGSAKLSRIPVKIVSNQTDTLRKPDWIRVRVPSSPRITELKAVLLENRLVTV